MEPSKDATSRLRYRGTRTKNVQHTELKKRFMSSWRYNTSQYAPLSAQKMGGVATKPQTQTAEEIIHAYERSKRTLSILSSTEHGAFEGCYKPTEVSRYLDQKCPTQQPQNVPSAYFLVPSMEPSKDATSRLRYRGTWTKNVQHTNLKKRFMIFWRYNTSQEDAYIR